MRRKKGRKPPTTLINVMFVLQGGDGTESHLQLLTIKHINKIEREVVKI